MFYKLPENVYIIKTMGNFISKIYKVVMNEKDIENLVVKHDPNSTPILVRDIAEVKIAPMTRQGAVTRDGRGEAVTGLVMMLIGENSREVVTASKARLEDIEKSLPKGVTLEITYDRSALISRTLKTVLTNLIEGGHPRDRSSALHAGELPGRCDRGTGDSSIDAVRNQPDGGDRHYCQPDESGGDRLWFDRRQFRDHGRKLYSPTLDESVRQALPGSHSGCRHRSAETDHVR